MYIYKAHIINVVDGDTFDAIVDLGFNILTRMRFRIVGVDTPELRSANESERESARVAKEYVKEKILGRDVIIATEKPDSFGRWLASVSVDGIDLAQKLLEESLAVPYKR